ncbi:MAG: hypothetical protein WAL75_25900 [Terracidiphilus sp.]
MYDTRLIPPETLEWAMNNAANELNAYLCEVDYREINGKKWPQIARAQALQCRIIGAVANRQADRESWLTLAEQFEDTIGPGD